MEMLKKTKHWCIAYRNSRDKKFSIIDNPQWGWCADPFLVEYRGVMYLFAEVFLYKSERNGVIAYSIFDGEKFGDWNVTMDKHWHLSFPNVFVHNDELYMCPESYQNETVSLYKLISFPDCWERVDVILDNVKYVDSIFLKYKKGEYMFTFAPLFEDNRGKLLLYEKRDGKYRFRELITESKTCGRPAGNIIIENDRLLRVCQNSECSYGDGLVFMEIDSITPTYKEHEVKRIYPNDISLEGYTNKIVGVHTYNRLGNIEVVDLKYEVSSEVEAAAIERTHAVFLNKYC